MLTLAKKDTNTYYGRQWQKAIFVQLGSVFRIAFKCQIYSQDRYIMLANVSK